MTKEIPYLTKEEIERLKKILLKDKKDISDYLNKVNTSLKKIKRGEYGICCECDSSIPFKRLRSHPVLNMCNVCKEDHEKKDPPFFSVTGEL